MIWPFSHLDITRQRVVLTVNALTGAFEGWFTDLLCKALDWLGLVEISFETVEPSNTRKLWLDQGATPTGAPSVLKVYDPDLDAWIKLTRSTYHLYESRLARPVVWLTSDFVTGQVRPPDAEVKVGDEWHHNVGGTHWFAHRSQLAPGQQAWLMMSGGAIDSNALNSASLATLGTILSLRATSISAAPIGTFDGQMLFVTDTRRRYIWTKTDGAVPDMWMDITA